MIRLAVPRLRHSVRFPAAALLAVLLVIALPEAGLAQLPPLADAFTTSSQGAKNFGSDANLTLDASPAKRIYLRFDAFSVPASASNQVARATLWLFPNTVNTAGSFDIFRVTSP